MNEDNPKKGLEYTTKRKIPMKFPGSWRLWRGFTAGWPTHAWDNEFIEV